MSTFLLQSTRLHMRLLACMHNARQGINQNSCCSTLPRHDGRHDKAVAGAAERTARCRAQGGAGRRTSRPHQGLPQWHRCREGEGVREALIHRLSRPAVLRDNRLGRWHRATGRHDASRVGARRRRHYTRYAGECNLAPAPRCIRVPQSCPDWHMPTNQVPDSLCGCRKWRSGASTTSALPARKTMAPLQSAARFHRCSSC